MAKTTTAKFDQANARADKEPIIVMEIEGVTPVFSSGAVYVPIKYDDPDVFYDAGFVYDGLRPLSPLQMQPLIDRKGSSATISQKLEQWDGRASVETLSIKVVDANGVVTRMLTPGLTTNEILNKKVRIWFGYKEIAYPDDYVLLFRGYINSTSGGQGSVMFSFTDPSSKRKQTLFNGAGAVLTQPLFGDKRVTFDILGNTVLCNDHGYSENAEVKFAVENGSLPPELSPGTKYFVRNPFQNSFSLSLTSGGAIIDLTTPTPGPVTPTYTVMNFDATKIDLSSTTQIYRTILNAKGVNDPSVVLGLVINGEEVVTYTNANITSDTQLNGVTRGAYGTTAVNHALGAKVECFIALSDNPLTIALKTMLSGWEGPFEAAQPMRSIVNDDAGHIVPDSFTFPVGVDAIRDYGLSPGDFATISGSSFPANNDVFSVAEFTNNNRTVIVQEKGILIQEGPGVGNLGAVVDLRSKYDTLPVTAGLALTPDDVFVQQWEDIRDQFVPFAFEMRQTGSENSAKEWMEKHLLRPIGAYSLTQNARISVGKTHPPLVTDLSRTIQPSNVVDSRSIQVERGLNNRFFYNSIRFTYAFDILTNEPQRSYTVVDADAVDRMQQVSELAVDVRGLQDNDDAVDILSSLANRILQRYRFAAETIKLTVFFGTGLKVDAGDIVVLTDTDPPILQIMNTETGTRGVVNRIMEVQERAAGITDGRTRLTLLSNNGFSFSDRYGVVGPASELDSAFLQTPSQIRYKDSFSTTITGTEPQKWFQYQQSYIKVFNPDFTIVGTSKYTLDPFDLYKMNLDPALGFTPTSDMVIQFADYDDTDPQVNALVKATFVHLNPTATILSGSTETVFTLDTGFSTRYESGMIVYVMSPDGSRFSPDVKILTVVGDIVTIGPIFTGGANPDLGFVPQASDLMQLAGFKDGGNGYRYI